MLVLLPRYVDSLAQLHDLFSSLHKLVPAPKAIVVDDLDVLMAVPETEFLPAFVRCLGVLTNAAGFHWSPESQPRHLPRSGTGFFPGDPQTPDRV